MGFPPSSSGSPLILHHYDFSNYSEKVRLVLGYKGFSWCSVQIPSHEPKPKYKVLTAGYRRTPALQVGSDIYCDTRLIVDVLQQLKPLPDLFPGKERATVKAHVEALIFWCEVSLMRPLALWITGKHADSFPSGFFEDRARLHGKPLPTLARVKASAAKYEMQVRTQIEWLSDLVGETGKYVLGESLSLADFSLVQAPWFYCKISPTGTEIEFPPNLRHWTERVLAVGHGDVSEISADEALDSAKTSQPAGVVGDCFNAPEGVRKGDRVKVTPFDDQNTPAEGTLLCADDARISIATETSLTGLVHVHFPRIGYRLSKVR